MATPEVKAVERLLGSGVPYAYAVKAGPWIFLTGHEAFDFAAGVTEAVAGPPGFPLFGRPRWRREGDFILQRMQRILQEFGSDLGARCPPRPVLPDPGSSRPLSFGAARRVRRLHPAEHLGGHGELLWRRERHLDLADRRGAERRTRNPQGVPEGCHFVGDLGLCPGRRLRRFRLCRRANGERAGARARSARPRPRPQPLGRHRDPQADRVHHSRKG